MQKIDAFSNKLLVDNAYQHEKDPYLKKKYQIHLKQHQNDHTFYDR